MPHALFLIVAIGLILSVFLWCIWFRPHSRAEEHGPTFLTTLGILFTFIGIGLGLLDFNTNDIQGSVPKLLDGMKTAIWASAVGVLCSLLLKWRFAKWGLGGKYRQPESESEAEDALSALNALCEGIGEMRKALEGIQNAIVGSDQGTLLSQMKLTRQETADKFNELIKVQKDFAQTMAENNSKALISALEEVMRDFNTKINEQLGDNFKQLNQAVGKILEWQEKYRQQMAEMIEQQTKTAANMTEATARFGDIAGKADAYTRSAEQLQIILTAITGQRDALQKSLSDLGSLLQTASGALPEIEKKIVAFAEQMDRGVRETNATSTKAIQEMALILQEEVESMTSNLRESGIATEKTVKETSENLRKITSELHQETAKAVQGASEGSAKAISETNESLRKVVGDIRQTIEKSTDSISEGLEKHLNDSLNALANQLASLSTKFAEDYTPLANRLREVVEIAKKG